MAETVVAAAVVVAGVVVVGLVGVAVVVVVSELCELTTGTEAMITTTIATAANARRETVMDLYTTRQIGRLKPY